MLCSGSIRTNGGVLIAALCGICNVDTALLGVEVKINSLSSAEAYVQMVRII